MAERPSPPEPITIDQAIERQRAALQRREREAVRDLVRAYRTIEQRLIPLITSLIEEISQTDEPSMGTLFRSQRYVSLLEQVRREMGRYATDTVGPVVDRAMHAAAARASDDAMRLTIASMGSADVEVLFTQLPVEAIEAIVGSTRSGPLAELLMSFGNHAAERARSALISGMALGYHPTKIARELKRVLGVNLTRARLIARTEINRAHREASRATYRANSHLVTGYVWHAACDERTCVVCWALHGTTFDLDTPMGAHPACRCALVPKTRTWRELGFTSDVPETRSTSPSGSDLFRRASPSIQKAVLGPRAYEAYRNGEVDITDFVKIRRSPAWGLTYQRGSLTHARMTHT